MLWASINTEKSALIVVWFKIIKVNKNHFYYTVEK